MRTLIILTLIFGINSCIAQSESEKKLIGKWIFVTETNNWDKEVEPLGETESESELNTTLTFKDKTVDIQTLRYGYNSTYKLTDSILIIGNQKYILIKLDKKKLIYKDKNGLFNNQYEYKKVE